MNPINILTNLKDRLSRIARRESGSSTIELAIIFPILLILFVGTAELGRLFYTYTTLAKATDVGARYLSTVPKNILISGSSTEIAAAKTEVRNLVVYGCKNRAVAPCSTTPPVVVGLTPANVNICDNFSVPCVPALTAGPIKYFRVEITGYTHQAGVWNLATMTGKASSTFYFALKPGTEMRYVP
ncbi:MAG TPA: TadE/TadG family type IV pilus assembly protein [Pyrinomonadaceae bacterium]|nr:TadE/TadG family type IV pilus assembly protein [Pyrinomonadaceae bacterium]